MAADGEQGAFDRLAERLSDEAQRLDDRRRAGGVAALLSRAMGRSPEDDRRTLAAVGYVAGMLPVNRRDAPLRKAIVSWREAMRAGAVPEDAREQLGRRFANEPIVLAAAARLEERRNEAWLEHYAQRWRDQGPAERDAATRRAAATLRRECDSASTPVGFERARAVAGWMAGVLDAKGGQGELAGALRKMSKGEWTAASRAGAASGALRALYRNGGQCSIQTAQRLVGAEGRQRA